MHRLPLFVQPITLCLTILICSSAVAQSQLKPPRYSITDLGPIGDVEQMSYTPNWSINRRGQVAGHSGFLSGNKVALLWSGGHMIRLGHISRVAVRDDGAVIGLRAPAHAKYNVTRYHTVLWKNGKTKDLGSAGARIGEVLGLLPNGVAVGSVSTAHGSFAALWKAGKLTDIGTLGSKYAVATASNKNGQVVGFSAPAGSEAQIGFLWDKGHMTALPTLPGYTCYAPTAISSSGYIAGWEFSISDAATSPSTPPDHALLWFHGKVKDLGTLGGANSHAYAVNDSGEVVGEAEMDPRYAQASSESAFVYKNGKMYNLNRLVPPLKNASFSATLKRHLSVAVGINGRGQIAVISVNTDNVAHLYLLTPIK